MEKWKELRRHSKIENSKVKDNEIDWKHGSDVINVKERMYLRRKVEKCGGSLGANMVSTCKQVAKNGQVMANDLARI